MALQIDTDTPAQLVPLAWLLGRWVGVGVVGYPTMDGDRRFGQQVTLSHDGRPFLSYESRTWALGEDGVEREPLAVETGFWRPVRGEPSPDAVGGPDAEGAPGVDLEVLLSHPTGVIEVYLGTARGPRVELATDAVVRTATAKAYTAARRMYGLVEGDLMWVMDMAAMGIPLTPHASARLRRVS